MGGTTTKLAPTLLASLALAPGIAGILCVRAEAAGAAAASPAANSTNPGLAGSQAEGSPASAVGASEGGHARGSVGGTPTVEPESIVSEGPITLQSKSAATLGQTLSFSGLAPVGSAGGVAAIERYVSANASWVLTGRAPIDPQGGFVVRWHANVSGRLVVRAVVLASGAAVPAPVPGTLGFRRASVKAATDAATEVPAAMSSGSTEVTVYKPSVASYYGPGFYGKETACGQTMTSSLIGVANRKLPCGTLVAISYDGRSLTVPVIDRGPYGGAASWDLTAGAAEALGATATVRVGTLVVGSVANTPLLGSPPEVPGALTESGGALAD
jgi:rare lipoprotein A